MHELLTEKTLAGETSEAPKIADFGLSVACARAATSGQERGGTPAFRAPEAWLRRGKVTVQADMFSYAGVLACIALKSDNPYDHEYPKSVLEERGLKSNDDCPTDPSSCLRLVRC